MAIEDLKESLGIDDDDFKGIKDGVNALDKSTSKFRKGMKGAKSVVKAAKGNIFEFPVFVSSSVPLDYATATTSLLEQVYASYLQMAISANPVISAKSAANGTQFAHLKSDTNKYLECVDTTYQADAAFNRIDLGYTMNGDNKFVEFSLINVSDGEARIINEQCDYQPLSEFDHFFQEAKTKPKDPRQARKGQSTVTSYQYDNKDNKTKEFKQIYPSDDEIARENREKEEYEYNKSRRDQNELMDAARLKQVKADHHLTTEKIADAIRSGKLTQKELDAWEADHKRQVELDNENLKNVQYRNEELLKQLGAMQAVEKEGKGSAQARELLAKIKTMESEQKKAEHDSSQKVLDALDRIMDLDEKIKQAQVDKSPEELKKLKAERQMAEKKFEDYEKDHEAQQAKIKAETEKLNAEIENMAKKYNLDLKAAERDAAKEARESEKYEYEKSRRRSDEMDAANRGRIRAPQFMDETKIQKLNTMKPLMMTVDLNVEGRDGRIVQGVEYIVGVKAYNRLVDSATLPEVVEYPLKEMNKITRKAKWRAGELKFFKDILFKIPQKKQTAIDSRDPKRKWYRRLYELAHIKGDAPAKAIINGDSVVKAFFKDKLGKYGDTKGVIPNATLVISKADVDIIKRETKIDMLKGSSAAKFCKELFMIAIIVIDNDAESIKILMPDLHNDYEVHSLSSVNKQLSLLDTSGTKTRDIFKLLG